MSLKEKIEYKKQLIELNNPHKYQIKDTKCVPVPNSHLFPIRNINNSDMIMDISDEELLKNFFNSIGVTEFSKLTNGVLSRDYFYKDSNICNKLLKEAYNIRNPKAFLKYFNRLEDYINHIENIIEKIRNNIFVPLQQTYTELYRITNEFNFKGNFSTFEPNEYTICSTLISNMIEIYNQDMVFLNDGRVHIRALYDYLISMFEQLKNSIKHNIQINLQLESYYNIIKTIEKIDKGVVKIIKKRINFIVYDHIENKWESGIKTIELQNCLNKIMEYEIRFAESNIQITRNEITNILIKGNNMRDKNYKHVSDNTFSLENEVLPTKKRKISKLKPDLSDPRSMSKQKKNRENKKKKEKELESYINYNDSLINMKLNPKYIKWFDNTGRNIFRTPIIKRERYQDEFDNLDDL
jgi:hypothetical protein